MAANDHDQWLERARTHQQQRLPIDAMLCLRRAIRANPRAAASHVHLAQVLQDLGRWQEAVAEWRLACEVDPNEALAHLSLAEALVVLGDYPDAADAAARAAALAPDLTRAQALWGIADLASRPPTSSQQRIEASTRVTQALTHDPALLTVPSVAGPLAATLQRIDDSAACGPILDRIAVASTDDGIGARMPALCLALLVERSSAWPTIAQAGGWSRASRRPYSAADHDSLRRIALAAMAAGVAEQAALRTRYARLCVEAFAAVVPLPWPRRTAGDALRSVVLIDADCSDHRVAAAFTRLARLSSPQYEIVAAIIGGSALPSELDRSVSGALQRLELPRSPSADDAKRLGALDADVLVDLVGLTAPIGPLLGQRPARELFTLDALPAPHAVPLVDEVFANTDALLSAVMDRKTHLARSPAATAGPAMMAALMDDAVRAHQRHDIDEAERRYADVIARQPGYAPALYLRGVLRRDAGDAAGARADFAAAIAAAPRYVDARVAAAKSAIDAGDSALALKLTEQHLAVAPEHVGLWRVAGLAQLARRDGAAAAARFARALALDVIDGDTHYNHGVALHMQGRHGDAARAYQRALTLRPDLTDAEFNLGVVFQERGATDGAIAAYRHVLASDPRHVAAYRNLGDVLYAARRYDDWRANFAAFEAACPDAFALAVQALEVCQHFAEFERLDRYLEALADRRFVARTRIELVDALEQLLYLLLFFDVEPEMLHSFALSYDAAARLVYGEPAPPPTQRRPGRLRIGYLSADMRDHVMGKMVWQAIEHHDRRRFELRFYSLSREEDEWTGRFRAIADGFTVLADLPEPTAAARIAADDLDLLVDLSTHTKGSKPGVLARKPARVQLTHVASAGSLGLSAVDFKLTDGYADIPENQTHQIEQLLAMDGCVYPYRHVAPAADHPFHRERFGIPADAIVIAAFVSPLKLSRRCLGLWRDVLERVPRARLAFSPINAEQRPFYERLAACARMGTERLVFLPQGADDAQNQARYTLVDFVLDPMPFGGVNGTLEALDMGVPVVTLRGRRHGERTSYSILANLGVTQTVAQSGPEYVEIAVRLAHDAGFAREVRSHIRAGLERSPLTDMAAHTRHLEDAYRAALQQRCPEVLVAASES